MYWELKSKCSSSRYLSGREELRSPEDCLSTIIIPAQGNRYKACRSPDLGLLCLLVSWCSLSDCLAAAPNCTNGFSIGVRPLALGQSSSQLYLILLTIILNYIVLQCVIVHSDTIFSKIVCFSSDNCRCFVFRPISLPFSLFFSFSLSQGMGTWVPPPL